MNEPVFDDLEHFAIAAKQFAAEHHPDHLGLCLASGVECRAFREALSPDLILVLIAENRRLRDAIILYPSPTTGGPWADPSLTAPRPANTS
mgnify:CR=1 FL=1